MSDIEQKCLEIFPTWLGSLGEDVQTLLDTVTADQCNAEAKRCVLGGINYLFKSLDLIPDGIDDIGYLDDAFVLRLSARLALKAQGEDAALSEKLGPLAEGSELIETFLEETLFERFGRYVGRLSKGAARGRTVDELVDDGAMFEEFRQEAQSFVREYTAPSFSADPKNLIKLKAFFGAKLPK